MTPTQDEIAYALDVLDGLSDEDIRPLREGVSRTIRIAAARRETGVTAVTRTTAATINWSPLAAAVFWVVWQTNDEVLERQLTL